jgi:hypothetical protein
VREVKYVHLQLLCYYAARKLNGADLEEDRTVAITKILLKLTKQCGCIWINFASDYDWVMK